MQTIIPNMESQSTPTKPTNPKLDYDLYLHLNNKKQTPLLKLLESVLGLHTHKSLLV